MLGLPSHTHISKNYKEVSLDDQDLHEVHLFYSQKLPWYKQRGIDQSDCRIS